jgi:hypothetical protein
VPRRPRGALAAGDGEWVSTSDRSHPRRPDALRSRARSGPRAPRAGRPSFLEYRSAAGLFPAGRHQRSAWFAYASIWPLDADPSSQNRQVYRLDVRFRHGHTSADRFGTSQRDHLKHGTVRVNGIKSHRKVTWRGPAQREICLRYPISNVRHQPATDVRSPRVQRRNPALNRAAHSAVRW